MEYIKTLEKMIIEFSGTPTSGKSSIIDNIRNKENKYEVKVLETVPIASEYDFDIRNYELRILWHILDTYSKVTNSLNSDLTTNSAPIILNRGLFDRIAWARFLRYSNEQYDAVSIGLERHLSNYELLSKIDVTFLLITSFEKIIDRRKNRGQKEIIGVFVNPLAIKNLNKIYIDLYSELKEKINIVLIDDSDEDVSLEQKITIVESHIYSMRIKK